MSQMLRDLLNTNQNQSMNTSSLLEIVKIIAPLAAGFLGGLYLRRRKLNITIISVQPSAKSQIFGFVTQLPKDMLDLLNKSNWASAGRQLTQQEDLALIHEQVRTVRVFLKASDFACNKLEEIITALENEECKRERLTTLVYEILSTHVLHIMIEGMANMGLLNLEENYTKQDSRFSIHNVKDGDLPAEGYILLAFPKARFSFSYEDPDEESVMELLAWHLACSDQKSILENLKLVKSQLNTDIRYAHEIIQACEPMLYARSRWHLSIQISNFGQSTIALSSHAVLEAVCGAEKFKDIDVVYRSDMQQDSEENKKNKWVEREKEIRYYGESLDFQDQYQNENIVIAPGDTRKINLISNKSIETYSNGEKLVNFWETSTPKYRIKMELIPAKWYLRKQAKSNWITTS